MQGCQGDCQGGARGPSAPVEGLGLALKDEGTGGQRRARARARLSGHDLAEGSAFARCRQKTGAEGEEW